MIVGRSAISDGETIEVIERRTLKRVFAKMNIIVDSINNSAHGLRKLFEE